MAIQMMDMGLDFTKGEGDKMESHMDFRAKQSKSRLDDASAEKFRVETKDAEAESILVKNRSIRLQQAANLKPEEGETEVTDLEKIDFMIAASVGAGDFEAVKAGRKSRQELIASNALSEKAEVDKAKQLSLRYSRVWNDLSIDASDSAIERTIHILSAGDNLDRNAAKTLNDWFGANKGMRVEDRQALAKQKVDPDYTKIMTAAQKETNAASPYFVGIPGSGGAVNVLNARTGVLSRGGINPDTGKPFVHARYHAETQQRIKYLSGIGEYFSKKDANAKYVLPDSELGADYMINLLDMAVGNADKNMKPHVGMSTFVGGTLQPGFKLIPGTDAASYEQLHLQIRGSAFLQAFEALKGGGQISNTEGEAATSALTRLSSYQKESEYVAAAKEFRAEVVRLIELARERATKSGNRFPEINKNNSGGKKSVNNGTFTPSGAKKALDRRKGK